MDIALSNGEFSFTLHVVTVVMFGLSLVWG